MRCRGHRECGGVARRRPCRADDGGKRRLRISFHHLPGVRPNQAERRFVASLFGGVGTALSADWMRPSRQPIIDQFARTDQRPIRSRVGIVYEPCTVITSRCRAVGRTSRMCGTRSRTTSSPPASSTRCVLQPDSAGRRPFVAAALARPRHRGPHRGHQRTHAHAARAASRCVTEQGGWTFRQRQEAAGTCCRTCFTGRLQPIKCESPGHRARF